MSGTSRIEWTDATWSPVIGCSHAGVSCQNCYAERFAARLAAMGNPHYQQVITGGRWNGRTALVESALDWPLHRHKPKRIFICSMGDLFHEPVPDEWIDRVIAIIALCPQHEFVLLTKRVERMHDYICDRVDRAQMTTQQHLWPLPNLTIGTSAGTQAELDDRVPLVLATPAARRIVSLEPLLEAVDLRRHIGGSDGDIDENRPGGSCCRCGCEWEADGRLNRDVAHQCPEGFGPRLNGVICGPETGPGRRPCDPAWIRAVVEQCRDAGVAVFVKAFPMPGNRISKDPAEWPEWARVREWPGKPGGKE